MKQSNKFFCFSPPVMLATFFIEIALLVYTLWKYNLNVVTRLSAAILFFLALFQLAEFQSCGAEDYVLWSKIGFVAITVLPPLGMHLILALAKQKKPLIMWGSYIAGALFASLFLFSSVFESHACTGNYVIFKLIPGVGGMYFAYYYGLLLGGLALALHFAFGVAKDTKRALLYQVFGYLSFLLPTTVVNNVNPKAVEAIPSVMCGFAVIYALTIVFGILPAAKTAEKQKTSTKK